MDEQKPKNPDEPAGAELKSVETPADALSMTPEELGQSSPRPEQTGESTEPPKKQRKKAKKDRQPSRIRRFLRRINLYLMMFIILLVIAAAVAVISFLYSQQEPPEAVIQNQPLSQEALEDLANTDVSIGNARQSVTIRGDAIIDGHTLMRSGADIAGTLQTSGKITGPSLTVSGDSNLGNTQINQLQVSGTTGLQGDLTLGGSLNVAGTSSFQGPMTASKITASQLVLSGNAQLEIPNHLAFTGPTPGQTVNRAALGSGGSASLSGSDASGTISLNSGGGPSSGCFITVSFRQSFSKTPRVVVSPVNPAAGNLNYYVKRGTTNFQICSTNAPAAHAQFGFDYFIAG